MVEIKQLIEDFGYTNPRLFKGVVKKELGHLNILVTLVDEEEDRNLTPILSRSLETLLDCDVVVTAEDELADRYRAQIIQEAVPLNDKAKLLEYYGASYQFDSPDQKMQTKAEIGTRELIHKHLIEEKKRKREKSQLEPDESNSCKKQKLTRAISKLTISDESKSSLTPTRKE